jgi:hypothetical protein
MVLYLNKIFTNDIILKPQTTDMKIQSPNKRLKQPVAVTLWADLWSGEKLGAFCF